MTMLELYGHIYDFFTSMTWWQLKPDTNLVVSVQPHPLGPAAAGQAGGQGPAARNDEGNLAVVYIPDGGM